MRVLMTGGYGCIGSWIARQLLERGDAVAAFDLREDPGRLKLLVSDAEATQVRYIPGDVSDLSALNRAIADFGATHVIHLAGLQVPVCRVDPIKGATVNVLGTLAVFEAVLKAGPHIDRLVYASSSAVYGPAEAYAGLHHPLADDTPLMPSTHYGVFKVCNEGSARIYHQDHGLSSVGLRPGTVYGVGRDFGMTSEPTKAIKSVALGRPYAISYGGLQDFQFARDVAGTFVQCLIAPNSGSKAYNLRGAVVDIAEFHATLCRVAPEAAELVTCGTRPLAISCDLDDHALDRDLGPMPKTSLEEGIRQTLTQFRQLHAEGRLTTHDLDAPAPVAVGPDEP